MSKPGFDHGRGGITSNKTGHNWSGYVDKRPHEQYWHAHNKYTGRTNNANITDAAGTATCRCGGRTHANGPTKISVVAKLLAVNNAQTKEEL